jgi:hypothetical protein
LLNTSTQNGSLMPLRSMASRFFPSTTAKQETLFEFQRRNEERKIELQNPRALPLTVNHPALDSIHAQKKMDPLRKQRRFAFRPPFLFLICTFNSFFLGGGGGGRVALRCLFWEEPGPNPISQLALAERKKMGCSR